MFTARDPKTRAWYRRYFGRTHPDDDWYDDLFPAGFVSGEIAEPYCTLDAPVVRRIRQRYPALRVIITLRNPVDRAISHAKKGLARTYGSVAAIPAGELIRHIADPSSRVRGAYSRAIDTWTDQFPGRVLVLFYDHLREAPEIYLQRICEFIGVEFAPEYCESVLNSVQNASDSGDVPREVLEYATGIYRSEIQLLAERYGEPARTWEAQAEGILVGARAESEPMRVPGPAHWQGQKWWVSAAERAMVATAQAAAAAEGSTWLLRPLRTGQTR
jgi:hypothetical protein